MNFDHMSKAAGPTEFLHRDYVVLGFFDYKRNKSEKSFVSHLQIKEINASSQMVILNNSSSFLARLANIAKAKEYLDFESGQLGCSNMASIDAV